MPHAAESASPLHCRAERCRAALLTTDDCLADAVGASPDVADPVIARLLRHRTTAARLSDEASALATAAEGDERRIRDLELAVRTLIGDAAVDEFTRKISHGEE